MTPPDPADVHTGTDRVELTEDERAQMNCGCHPRLTRGHADTCFVPVVESIVAARQETNRRIHEQMKQGIETMTSVYMDRFHELTAERDAARAELAAANTREKALSRSRDRLQRERDRTNVENARLRSITERVTALADRWEARADDMHEDARQILLNHARHIRDLTGPDIPLPEQHTCDDYCQTCREPGEA